MNSEGGSRHKWAVVVTSKSVLFDSTRYCQMLGFALFGEKLKKIFESLSWKHISTNHLGIYVLWQESKISIQRH